MPLAFPSHQGLIAPLWRVWPNRFSLLALWVGALVPDVVDGFENIAIRGHFQQWIGHTLIGASTIGVAVGLALTGVVRRSARRLASLQGDGAIRDSVRRIAKWTLVVDNPARTASFARRARFEAFSVWIGALSHVVFDALTHERSRLLWPFCRDPAWFGESWSSAWFHVSAPGYPDYPIGPHFVGWIVLSVAGAVMFFRWPPRPRDR